MGCRQVVANSRWGMAERHRGSGHLGAAGPGPTAEQSVAVGSIVDLLGKWINNLEIVKIMRAGRDNGISADTAVRFSKNEIRI